MAVRADAGGLSDHSPGGVSIRSRVDEYGGGALCPVPGGTGGAIAYVDQADQRVWLCHGPDAGDPVALTATPPAGEAHNHGGLCATADGDWVLAVREIQSDGSTRPVRTVVALSTRAAAPCATTVLDGHDFFGAPRPASDGRSAGRRRLGPSGHAMGRRGAPRPAAHAPRLRRLQRGRPPTRHPPVGWARTAGRRWSRRVGRPARLAQRRIVAVRLGQEGMVAALRRRRSLRGGAHPDDHSGGRVSRTGLGTRAAHDGGDRRRHAAGAPDGIGPGRGRRHPTPDDLDDTATATAHSHSRRNRCHWCSRASPSQPCAATATGWR